MPTPSRKEVESMAFMAMMDGIGISHLSCSCPTCKSDRKTRPAPRPQNAKRPDGENLKPTLKPDAHISICNHSHSVPLRRPSSSTTRKPATQPSTQNKPTSNTSSTSPANLQGRESKVNNLLKACNEKAIFEVFNSTMATTDEKELASLIQNATKDSKIYNEVKQKILEVCDDDDVELEAVFGLLAKFRQERNLLTTAILKSNVEREKSNTEREKALLCIKRVDDLMYMLQDVAKKPKDADGDTFMHKLGDIIMEIHDLAKVPSSLYEELLDIREEHFQLVDDHEEMHQKFVDVNSCHDKLHSNHDKLQQSHTKLKEEHAEAKKKSALVGGLKSDVTRLEKLVEKSNSENADLKKEVEKLSADLAKVNALKHENAQLKKKVTTLATVQSTTEESAPAPPVPAPSPALQPAGKKKKGKKGQTNAPQALASTEPQKPDIPASIPTLELVDKTTELELAKLKKSHDSLARELGTLRENLAQLETLRRRAESSRDQAVEKLQFEQATSQNWQGIAHGHNEEKRNLKAQLDQSGALATKLQNTISKLEKNLAKIKDEMAGQQEAHAQVKAELENRSRTPATSVSSQAVGPGQEAVRILHKMKAEISQLVGDLEESKSYGGDIHNLLNMIQITVRKVMMEMDNDIDQILGIKSNNSSTQYIPEAVLPFAYGNSNAPRLTAVQHPGFASRQDYSPQASPQLPFSATPSGQGFVSYRPMIPPGFSEPSPAPSSHHGFSRAPETSSMSSRAFNATPSSSSSFLNSSPAHLQSSNNLPQHSSNPPLGPIGSRSSGTNAPAGLNKPSNTNTRHPMTPSPIGTPAPSTTSAVSNLGNGAVGVDWSMWSKPAK